MDHDPAVETSFAEWVAALGSLDADRLKGLWDHDFPALVLQPEETTEPLTSWAAIDGYLTALGRADIVMRDFREVETTYSTVGEATLVFTRIFVALGPPERSFDGEVRFTQLAFHGTPAGWRLVHQHESREVDMAAALG